MTTFHYGHLLPEKPGLVFADPLRVIYCETCKVPVLTRSRLRERCDACIKTRTDEKQQKTNAKRKRARESRVSSKEQTA